MFFCLRPHQFPKRTFTVRVPRDPPKEKRLQITDGWILLAVFLPEQRVTGCIEEQLVKLFKPLFIVPSSTRCISVSLCMWTSAPSCITTTTRLHQSVLPRRPAVLFISMNLSCRLKQHAGTNPSTDRPFPSSCFISTPGTSHRPPPSLSLSDSLTYCVFPPLASVSLPSSRRLFHPLFDLQSILFSLLLRLASISDRQCPRPSRPHTAKLTNNKPRQRWLFHLNTHAKFKQKYAEIQTDFHLIKCISVSLSPSDICSDINMSPASCFKIKAFGKYKPFFLCHYIKKMIFPH